MAENKPPEKKVPEGYVQKGECICPSSGAGGRGGTGEGGFDDYEEEDKRVPCETTFQTCPYDPRFPHQNQTARCYFSFIDYQRCGRLLGDYPGCNYFLKCYRSLCPSAWYERWYEQMENGTFPMRIYPQKPIIYPPKGVGTAEYCYPDITEEPPVKRGGEPC